MEPKKCILSRKSIALDAHLAKIGPNRRLKPLILMGREKVSLIPSHRPLRLSSTPNASTAQINLGHLYPLK